MADFIFDWCKHNWEIVEPSLHDLQRRHDREKFLRERAERQRKVSGQ